MSVCSYSTEQKEITQGDDVEKIPLKPSCNSDDLKNKDEGKERNLDNENHWNDCSPKAIKYVLSLYLEVQDQVHRGEALQKSLAKAIHEKDKLCADLRATVDKLNSLATSERDKAKFWEEEKERLSEELKGLKAMTMKTQDDMINLTSAHNTSLRKLHSVELELSVKTDELNQYLRQNSSLNHDLITTKNELSVLRGRHECLVKEQQENMTNKNSVELTLRLKSQEAETLKAELEKLNAKVCALVHMNKLASVNMEKLLEELSATNRRLQQEAFEKQEAQEILKLKEEKNFKLELENSNLQNDLQCLKLKTTETQEEYKKSCEAAEARDKLNRELLSECERQVKEITFQKENVEAKLRSLQDALIKAEDEKIKIHQEGQKELTVRRDEILKLEQEIADKGKQISQLKDEKEELVKNLDDVTEKLQQEKESHALVQEAIQSLEESNKESLLKVEMEKKIVEDLTIEVEKTRKATEKQMELKNLELQQHLKEISLQNNQALISIRKKLEMEQNTLLEKEKKKFEEELKIHKEKVLMYKEAVEKADVELLDQKKKHEIEITETVRKLQSDHQLKASNNWNTREAELQKLIEEKDKAIHGMEEEITRIQENYKVEKEAAESNYQAKLIQMVTEKTKPLEEELDLQKSLKSTLESKYTEIVTKLEQAHAALDETKASIDVLKISHSIEIENIKKDFYQKMEELSKTAVNSPPESDAKVTPPEIQGTVQEAKVPVFVEVPEVVAEIQENIAINVDSDADLTDGPLKGSTNLKISKGKKKRSNLAGQKSKKCGRAKNANLHAIQQIENENAVFEGIPNHSVQRKVTSHEYEVETSEGGRKVTRRKRTQTLILGDGNNEMRPPNASQATSKSHNKRGKIPNKGFGELFGSTPLNPYTDDPYALE